MDAPPGSELTVTDDTLLEEHNEEPCLAQMRLIGDGVVESIPKEEDNVHAQQPAQIRPLCDLKSSPRQPDVQSGLLPSYHLVGQQPTTGAQQTRPHFRTSAAGRRQSRQTAQSTDGTREEELRKKPTSPTPNTVTAASHSTPADVDMSTVSTTPASSSESPAGTSESRGVDNTRPQQCTVDDVHYVRAPEAASAERSGAGLIKIEPCLPHVPTATIKAMIQQGLVPNPIYTSATPTTRGPKLLPPDVL
ncbi:hypothetical protein HPB52_002707 [Rhipicephalus sanguineus]|uniref:Lysine-specific demethylase 3A/B tudor domain-containing protein n=1 Tax=Rhipicephalus sanguineus TaxID=34632 RepID=A0A9D4PIM6_RHISA|nr:hypothetical protein HPB52_002707 [Rhipicephalus sanguineus]